MIDTLVYGRAGSVRLQAQLSSALLIPFGYPIS